MERPRAAAAEHARERCNGRRGSEVARSWPGAPGPKGTDQVATVICLFLPLMLYVDYCGRGKHLRTLSVSPITFFRNCVTVGSARRCAPSRGDGGLLLDSSMPYSSSIEHLTELRARVFRSSIHAAHHSFMFFLTVRTRQSPNPSPPSLFPVKSFSPRSNKIPKSWLRL